MHRVLVVIKSVSSAYLRLFVFWPPTTQNPYSQSASPAFQKISLAYRLNRSRDRMLTPYSVPAPLCSFRGTGGLSGTLMRME